MMNKRGIELSTTTIIVMIMALLVLVVMAFIFTGSSATLQEKIRSIFQGGTGGSDIAIAEAQCKAACQTAKALENKALSGYCTNAYDIKDLGENINCKDIPAIDCPGVEEFCS